MIDVNNIRECANTAGMMNIPAIRRSSISHLVYWLQDIMLDNHYHPGTDGLNKLLYESRTAHEIERELKRRELLPVVAHPNNGIINAIKDRASLPEVIEQFTPVYYYSRDKWKFACPLHSDQHPSGNEITGNRWKCYQCNKWGDVIDAVELFGRMSKSQAVHWLSKYYGIDLSILPEQEDVKEMTEEAKRLRDALN